MIKMPKQKISISHHLNQPVDELDLPFIDIYKNHDDTKNIFLKNSVSHVPEFNGNINGLCEYAAFYSLFPLENYIENVGLYQYRRMLDLSDQCRTYLPFSERKSFALDQLQYFEKYKDNVVLAEPYHFSNSCWDQFVSCVPDCENALYQSCKVFDKMFDGTVDSEIVIKTSNFLYHGNLFFGIKQFAQEWRDVSLTVCNGISHLGQTGINERYIPYCLERLFSVFVCMKMLQNQYLFVTKSCVLFY